MAEAIPPADNSLPATPAPAPDLKAGAAAALEQALQQQQDAARKRVEDSEVVDPDARPQRYNKQPATPSEPEPKAEKPRLVEGATAEEPKAREEGDPLFDRALAVNIPLEDAQGMSRNTLRRLVVQLEQRSQPAAQPRAEQTPRDEEEEFSLPEIESGDPDVEVLPGLKKALDPMREEVLRLRREAAELRQRDEARKQEESHRAYVAAERQFGKLIAAEPDLHDELGSTPGYPDDPAQMKARNEVWQFYTLALNRGKEPEEAFRIASRAVYGDKLADREAKKTSEKAEAAAKRFTRPPAGGKHREAEFGKERARQELDAHFARQGRS
jgi:hypothetical protein